MEFEQILAIIDRVSSSKLTSFEFEEGNLKLSMERGRCRTLPSAGQMCRYRQWRQQMMRKRMRDPWQSKRNRGEIW